MLKLKKLKLYGWLSYKEAEIDLDKPGITHILGDVGSGKSAIVEAICFTLFGTTLRKGSVEDLENKILKDGYDIELDFEKDNIPAKIRATRNRPKEIPSGISFSTFKDGVEEKRRGKSDLETKKNIASFINISFEEFRATSIIGQRQTQVLIEGGPTSKAKTISDLFMLEAYDSAIDSCDEEIKNSKKGLEQLSNTVKSTQAEITALEKAAPDPVDEDIYNYVKEEEKEDKEKLEKAEEKMSQLRVAEDKSSRELGRIDAEKRQRQRYEELEKQIQFLEEKLKTIPEPTRSINEINNSIRIFTEEKVKAGYELCSVEKSVQQANKVDNFCPISKQKCPTKVPESYKEEILKECSIKLKDLESKKEDYVNRLAECVKEKENAEKYIREKEKLEREKENANKFIPTSSGNEEAEKQRAEKIKEAIVKGKDYIKNLQKRVSETREKISAMNERKANIKKFLSEINIKKEKYEIEKKLWDKAEEEFRYIEVAAEILKKVRLAKIELVVDLLNKNLNDTLQEISNGRLSARFITSKLDSKGKKVLDKIDLLAYDSNKELPICMWSGGQITQISLALLLSVLKVSQELSEKTTNCLWLDEPFEFLGENLDDIVEEIIRITSKHSLSVKMMSHRSLNEEKMDHIWEVTQVEGISTLEEKF